ncbi:MAG TPA: hypothetical protein PKD19_03505 [Candidatus Saccharibacteria bacterium]|jgi:hypothetical protein|nr:hypothetical protein [Candidatus Saccharibacteria bacterium]HMR38640.1 hypothetical protein [Candidatus Saccharibacteria bacterium]
MNSVTVGDLALERKIQDTFGPSVDIGTIILRQVAVGRSANATVFLTKKKQLMLYVEAMSSLLLADVKQVTAKMGLKAELFMPPKGQPHYFDDIGRAKFREVFPGRSIVHDDDIIYYKTLAPYNPALVIISEVKNGEIYHFDPDARGGWRLGVKFTYRRIRTS